MRVGLLAFGLISCAAGVKPETIVTRDVLAAAAIDVTAMTRLLRGTVVNGGLWFEDPACKAQFPAGDIGSEKLAAFARCLVGLKLSPSPREHALADVTLMTYEPGFEVELRVVSDEAGPHLQWIGFSAKRAEDTLPTISGDALEAHRVAGDRDGPLDAAAIATVDADLNAVLTSKADSEPKDYAFAWLKVCIDAAGAVTSADSFVTTGPDTETVFVAAARAWKFRPFAIRDQPVPVCAMLRMTYPPKAAPPPETIPMPPPPVRNNKRILVLATPKLLARVAGETNIVPTDLTRTKMAQAKIARGEGTFRMCIDEKGAVESVLPMKPTGLLDYDQTIMSAMKLWRYSPYRVGEQPVPVCTTVAFKYSVKS